MKLLFRLPPDQLTEAYSRLRSLFRNNEMVLFNSMQNVAATNGLNFSSPTSPSEYEQKHREIMSKLRRGRIRGRDTAILLMEEILEHIQVQGGVRGISNEAVLEKLYFETADDGVFMRLNEGSYWSAEWEVSLDYRQARGKDTVEVDIHHKDEGEITPTYVVEYISSGMYNYSKGMYATSVALLTIAVEATLRDVLSHHNYSYNPRASSVDVYSYTNAKLKVTDDGYLIEYPEPMPKATSDFLTSTGGVESIDLRVRRLIKPRTNGDRTDIYMLVPECVVDHLSTDVLSTPAERAVNGLGAAFRIVRDSENLITAEDLPLDFEEVLTVVRNNLIHLSGEALETPLNAMDASGSFTLSNFLEDGEIVFDFIMTIPEFINGMYRRLRTAQHTGSDAA